ncbi:hypothetical protein CC78DRAFT_531109 [Lojkania enalia]|uniref:F-box domain-containing protein n=1 Tax=Lojkania enalia TaxID=147567 RepID=A0A9P4KF47_9PLEO|nr:hypothetical protein CC78DRAFT_531109 [Didymosphaeria enalia]
MSSAHYPDGPRGDQLGAHVGTGAKEGINKYPTSISLASRGKSKASGPVNKIGFAQLPAELQIDIFGYLNRSDLKSVRGVCKVLCNNASPRLFRSVVACARYQALSAMQKLSLHHAYKFYVKEIVFDGSVYDQSLAFRAERYAKEAEKFENLRHGFSWEIQQRYRRYKELYEDQENMRQGGVLLHTIARALEWMPNISSVVYSPTPRLVPVEANIVRDLLPRGVMGSCYWDRRYEQYIESSQHGIHHLIAAIYLAQYSGIHEFRAELPNPDQSDAKTDFTIYVFSFPDPQHLDAGKYFFRQLRKVELNISLVLPGCMDQPHADQNGQAQLSNISALLAEARDLEKLALQICDWDAEPRRMYGHILPSNQSMLPHFGLYSTWPKLRSLILGGIYAAEKEVLDLLTRHKDTLVEAKFSFCSLLDGAWANIIDEVVYGTRLNPFQVISVNETVIGGVNFCNMSDEMRKKWQYVGHVAIDSDGQRYFVSCSR